MKEMRFDDKSQWGLGPWQNEPDKIVWVDPSTDLDCMIRRAPGGNLCGYVGIPAEHPWHHETYWRADSASPLEDLEVHGGITFADHCDGDEDGPGICHRPKPGRPDHIWWIGFDCAHAWDLRPRDLPGIKGDVYRDVPYVKAEVESLAKQVGAAA